MNQIAKIIITSLAAISLGANAEDGVNDRFIDVGGKISSINEELGSQRAKLGTLQSHVNSQERVNREIINELKALRRQNQALIDSLFSGSGGSSGKVNNVTPIKDYDMQTPDGKMFLGGSEFVYLKEANALIDARIDSGARQCSISAKDITEFERKGKKWVRFNIVANERTIPMEAPIAGYTTVSQSSLGAKTIRRTVVRLNVKIGDYSTRARFNLHDRSHMQYTMLIGRNLLRDVAVIDVSREHIQPMPVKKDTALTILTIDDYAEAKKKGVNPNEVYDKTNNTSAGQIASHQSAYGKNLGKGSESSDKAKTQNN